MKMQDAPGRVGPVLKLKSECGRAEVKLKCVARWKITIKLTLPGEAIKVN